VAKDLGLEAVLKGARLERNQRVYRWAQAGRAKGAEGAVNGGGDDDGGGDAGLSVSKAEYERLWTSGCRTLGKVPLLFEARV
jgi:hypothetical protein